MKLTISTQEIINGKGKAVPYSTNFHSTRERIFKVATTKVITELITVTITAMEIIMGIMDIPSMETMVNTVFIMDFLNSIKGLEMIRDFPAKELQMAMKLTKLDL